MGIILIDIMLALALATVFVSIMTTESMSARQIFENAKESEMKIESDIFKPDNLNENSNISLPLCSTEYFNKNIVGSYTYDDFYKSHDHVSESVNITPISLPIDPSITLTDFQIRNGIAYISADSSITSDPDIFTVDFKDNKNIKLLSYLNTGPGISAITLVDDYVYAAVPSTAGQLQIIKIGDLETSNDNLPTKLTLEVKYKLPLPTASTSPAKGSSVFYYHNRIFLGTEKWEGEELNVLDISNPIGPIKIAGFETGGKVKNILVNNDIAYIAGADMQQLRMLNVTDSYSPILINSFSPSGSSRQEGNSLSLVENNLVFGRTSGGFNIKTDAELFVFASSSYIDIDSPVKTLDIPGGVYGVVQDKEHVFLATRNVDQEVQIYNKVLATTTKVYSLPVAPQRLTCDGNKLYILSATAPVIYEISFN